MRYDFKGGDMVERLDRAIYWVCGGFSRLVIAGLLYGLLYGADRPTLAAGAAFAMIVFGFGRLVRYVLAGE